MGGETIGSRLEPEQVDISADEFLYICSELFYSRKKREIFIGNLKQEGLVIEDADYQGG